MIQQPIKTLDDLADCVEKLKELLDDPHPGLSSWCSIYGELMSAINDFWQKGVQSE